MFFSFHFLSSLAPEPYTFLYKITWFFYVEKKVDWWGGSDTIYDCCF